VSAAQFLILAKKEEWKCPEEHACGFRNVYRFCVGETDLC